MSTRYPDTMDVNVTDLLSDRVALHTLKKILKTDEITPQFVRQLQQLRAILIGPAENDQAKETHNLMLKITSDTAELRTQLDIFATDHTALYSQVADVQQTVHHEISPELVKIGKVVRQVAFKMDAQDVRMGEEEDVQVKKEETE
jgi:hypothetical protein